MQAILIFSLLTAHSISMAMDNPPKKALDPKIWQRLPGDMRNKVLCTHFIDTFESPEYTPNVNVHIRNMRTICKEYRNFIQKPETMFYVFQQLRPVNIDIQNIFRHGPESALIKAARINDIPAIHLSLIYNCTPSRLNLLLTHREARTLRKSMQCIAECNIFRPEELRPALVKARKEQNTDQIKALVACNAPIEEISFIQELKPEYRGKAWIRGICHFISITPLKAHILLEVDSSIYDCKLPITTAPLLCLAIGDYELTKQLLKDGINPHNNKALKDNIVQKKNKCVALLFEHIVPDSLLLVDAVCSQNAFAVELILKKNKNVSDQEIRPCLTEAVMNFDKETVKLLLEYIQDKQIKLDVFNTVKQKMMEHRSNNKKSKGFTMPHFKKKKVPITSIFAIFCDNLEISFAQEIQNIDREIEAHDN